MIKLEQKLKVFLNNQIKILITKKTFNANADIKFCIRILDMLNHRLIAKGTIKTLLKKIEIDKEPILSIKQTLKFL